MKNRRRVIIRCRVDGTFQQRAVAVLRPTGAFLRAAFGHHETVFFDQVAVTETPVRRVLVARKSL
jgi:hypothetical protein